MTGTVGNLGFRYLRQFWQICNFDRSPGNAGNLGFQYLRQFQQVCNFARSAGIVEGIESQPFRHFRQITGIVEHRCFRYLWQTDHSGIFGRHKFCRNCRSFAELQGLLKISWFWICMCKRGLGHVTKGHPRFAEKFWILDNTPPFGYGP